MRFTAGKPGRENMVRFVFEGETGDFRRAARDENFTCKIGEVAVFHPGRPARRVIAAGLGKKDGFDAERLRRAAAAAAKKA